MQSAKCKMQIEERKKRSSSLAMFHSPLPIAHCLLPTADCLLPTPHSRSWLDKRGPQQQP